MPDTSSIFPPFFIFSWSIVLREDGSWLTYVILFNPKFLYKFIFFIYIFSSLSIVKFKLGLSFPYLLLSKLREPLSSGSLHHIPNFLVEMKELRVCPYSLLYISLSLTFVFYNAWPLMLPSSCFDSVFIKKLCMEPNASSKFHCFTVPPFWIF